MYRAPLAIALHGSNQRPAPALRSSGPAASSPSTPPRAFDPVQIGWLGSMVRDDLDPDNADPLAPADDSLRAFDMALRPWHPQDAAQLRALLDDPEVWTHLPEDFPDTLCDRTAGEMIQIANLARHHQVRAVLLSGQPVGQIRLEYDAQQAATPIPERPEAEISYWLGRAGWGKGLGRAMVAGGVTRAFANAPGLLRLVAKVKPGNTGSLRVLENAGFARIAPPAGRGFGAWIWFGLRRRCWALARAQSL